MFISSVVVVGFIGVVFKVFMVSYLYKLMNLIICESFWNVYEYSKMFCIFFN